MVPIQWAQCGLFIFCWLEAVLLAICTFYSFSMFSLEELFLQPFPELFLQVLQE